MPVDPVQKAKAEATAGRDMARFWERWDNYSSAETARARMDAALDRLLELGIGATTPAR